jgi:hypothetical protein
VILIHRLDEYLQATRISIEPDRLAFEFRMTPGAEIADGVIRTFDADHNGEISKTEAETYLNAFLKSVALEVDGKPHSLTLDTYKIPPLADIKTGDGVIRVQATAAHVAASDGAHHLKFSNTHRADIGVYLVNALVPKDDRIAITGQTRDMLQREYEMDYVVGAPGSFGQTLPILLPVFVSLALAGVGYLIARKLK